MRQLVTASGRAPAVAMFRARTPMSFNKAGLDLYLVGETHSDLAGSEWAFLHSQRVGQSPDADLQREMRLIELLLEGNISTRYR